MKMRKVLTFGAMVAILMGSVLVHHPLTATPLIAQTAVAAEPATLR